MSDFNGTKQEWVRDGTMVYALEGGENRFYAGFSPGRNCLNGEVEANAQLAVAAPELLEALISMVDIATTWNSSPYAEKLGRVKKARAAIAKAIGKEE